MNKTRVYLDNCCYNRWNILWKQEKTMKSDMQIRYEGFQALFDNMDIVDAEKFIALINRDRFDYTK